jgi:hypothetical protein
VSLLLHAITLLPETEPDVLQAFRGGRLVRAYEAGLCAWATELSDSEAAFTRGDLLAHHDVVSGIFARAQALLPARFPTIFDNVAAVTDRLGAREQELKSRLDRVRGCCELAVTILWTTADEPSVTAVSESPGRNYLMQRQLAFAGSDRRRARARDLADELERLAQPNLVTVRHSILPSERVALSSALLVPRSHAVEVGARLVRTEHDVRILVNGPWPPYTFAAVGSD